MHKNFDKFMRLTATFVLLAAGALAVAAQNDPITGTWEASVKEKNPDKIYFQFAREDTGSKHRGKWGSEFAYTDFDNLSRSQALSSNSKVSFRLVREAGTIEAQGVFNDGKGSGTFRFVPNRDFASAMENRGFSFTDEKLFAATTLNVTTAVADGLLAAGFQNLDEDDLFKAVIFKVTPEFMSEMAAIGFPNLGMEDLVKARIFKIDANYAREIANMGYRNDSLETLVQFRIFKVTPEFLREVRAEGFSNLTAQEAVQMRIFKIDGAFIRDARSKGYTGTDVSDLVEMKIGVRNKN